MTSFESLLQDCVVGKLTTFDRMIFHGHLSGFFPKGAFARFLFCVGVLLKGFGAYVEQASKSIKAHAQAIAEEAGRPFHYLSSAHTHASEQSKENLARDIVKRDGVKEGLICVFSVLETCWSFGVQGNKEKQKLEVVRRKRKCLHYYFYFIDPRFGFMHVRLQSWFPFQIQVYVNGREWLAREMDKAGIGYARYDNTFTRIDDLQAAEKLCEEFPHARWPEILDVFARRVNPMLPVIEKAGFGGYYWCLDQCEVATDVMFRDRATLERLMPDLYDYAIRAFSAEDVMRFLGRKLHPLYQGEVTTDSKKRPEGKRIKHRAKQNSIKMYDKANVLRIETTINNPREFKVLKTGKESESKTRRWVPMGKGVANIWRYLQVGMQANTRYLEALSAIQPKGEAIEALDDLCRSRTTHGKRFAKLNPVTQSDCNLFSAVMAGENLINGFRNHDIRNRLAIKPLTDPVEIKRACARTSRKIAKLRGHGLVAKVRGSRLYRVTSKGFGVMAAALRYRGEEFPRNYCAFQ
jgi:hypothetical protein